MRSLAIRVQRERHECVGVEEPVALFHKDLDVQTFVQLMLSAKQATAHDAPLSVAIT